MKGEPLPEVELRRAKDHLKGSLMLSLESTGSRMNHIARQEIYFGRQFGLDEITAGIESVSAHDVAAHRERSSSRARYTPASSATSRATARRRRSSGSERAARAVRAGPAYPLNCRRIRSAFR